MIGWLEVTLALLANLHGYCQVFGFLSYAGLVPAFFYLGLSKDCGTDADVAFAWKAIKRIALCAVLATPLMLLPTLKDIWEVRIALIKLQLAAPENIQTGVETIERIGKALECKYVGCKEKP